MSENKDNEKAQFHTLASSADQSGVKILCAYCSERGGRAYNEDSVRACIKDDAGIFLVADGLGGHGNGDVASDLVASNVVELWKNKSSENYRYWKKQISEQYLLDEPYFLDVAICLAQKELCKQKSTLEYGDMMTTLVAMEVNQMIQWGHIGDSRLYYFQDGVLQKQTLDHSVPQVLVYTGEITPDEIRLHPDRNRLLKALGKERFSLNDYVIEKPIKIYGNQAFLLCSDGFWEYVLEDEMQRCLEQSDSPEMWLNAMEEIILTRADETSMDNFSAVTVWVQS